MLRPLKIQQKESCSLGFIAPKILFIPIVKKNLTLEEMADVSCLNQFYFLRQFKKMFHCTPHKYLQLKRIQEASQLLSTTNNLVMDVCNEVGFCDHASFSKLFKRHFGMSPIQFSGKRSVRNVSQKGAS